MSNGEKDGCVCLHSDGGVLTQTSKHLLGEMESP